MADELATIGNPFPVVNEDDEGSTLGFLLLDWLSGSNREAPPYWSRNRDAWLRDFVEDNGPLLTAVATFINKAVTIPFKIVPKDMSNVKDVEKSAQIKRTLDKNSGSIVSTVNTGFKIAMKMFIMDFLTQDNGAFFVVMGRGPADGPIIGPALGLLHIDSARCTRTKDAEYPVLYSHDDGKLYKLHWTRVITMVNMPSARAKLNGVGMCPVSCCLEAAQEMWDMYKHSAEKFGSRPPKQILYAETGATVRNLESAIGKWSAKMDSQNRDRFGGTLIAAPRTAGGQLNLKLLDLSSVPDGFARRDAAALDKAEIASAFGLDLRDLAYSFGISGQTRADAEVQDRKGRGKGIGEFIETFSSLFDSKFLNDRKWNIQFDYLDDDQDQQRAIIRDTRSQSRERDLRTGVTTVRVEREEMWSSGEISQDQFENMELEDGRLPNGLDVTLLFVSEDADYALWLDLGVEDPVNVEANDPIMMADTIREKILEVSRVVDTMNNKVKERKARQALAALERLQGMYQESQSMLLDEQSMLEAGADGMDMGAAEEEVEVEDDIEDEDEESAPEAEPPPQETKQIDEEIVGILSEYEDRFRHLVAMTQDGTITRERFEEALVALVAEILAMLFLRGANLVNAELTMLENGYLHDAIAVHLESVKGFANDLYSGRYIDNPGAALTRIFLWTSMAAGVYALGQLRRRDNPRYQWRLNPLKDHCGSCVGLNGQVHTAQQWLNSGYIPQGSNLECRGFNCGCTLVETDAPERGNFI